jgi:hypothetical protein
MFCPNDNIITYLTIYSVNKYLLDVIISTIHDKQTTRKQAIESETTNISHKRRNNNNVLSVRVDESSYS